MSLIDGPTIVDFLRAQKVTHLVWIPDSTMGEWDPAVTAAADLTVVRPVREGEAIAIAGGLWLGGKRPLVAVQCTGFFEAGDALRNIVYDLGVPLFMIVGCRSYFARQRGSRDTAPQFAERILEAWQLGYTLLDRPEQVASISEIYRRAQAAGKSHVLLLAE